MDRPDVESRIALAMLPVGALFMLASAVGAVAVVTYAVDALGHWPADAGWRIGWSLVAAIVATVNFRKGIETMATFDWHVAIVPAALSIAIAVAWPGWWA